MFTAAPVASDGSLHRPVIDALAEPMWAAVVLALVLCALVIAFVALWVGNKRVEEQQRAVAQQLAQSEARFKDYAEVAADWLWELDEDLRFKQLSGRRGTVFGHPPAELLGQPATVLLAAYNSVELERALQSREAFRDIESHVKTPQGESRWFSSSARPLVDHAGRFLGYRGISSEQTGRKRAEMASAESEARYRLLADNATDMIVRTDLRGVCRYVSPACRELLGVQSQDLIGVRLRDLAHPDDIAATTAAFDNLHSDHDQSYAHTFRVRHKDGRWIRLESRYRLIQNELGEPIEAVSVVRDISERVRLEDQLRQSQKMEAVGQLTGGIAHDFNNLLTVILGNAEMLADELSGHELKPLAVMTMEAAERAADLTQKLLAFSRRQSLKPECLSLNEVVRGIEPLLKRTIGEHIELRTEVRDEPLWAMVDRSLLESALLNLVVNARDAMLAGGVLTITTGASVAGAADGGIPVGQQVACLIVADTGTGMAPEVLARVFEPFFTTKEVGKGSGLGLSMVYGFAQQSGGHVAIRSQEGEGTSVSILLPAVPPQVATVKPQEALAAAAGRERVLLVEDEAAVRRFVAEQIQRLGYKVIAVSNAGEALAVLEREKDIDLLFTDVVLPQGMSGIELAGRVREMGRKTKILLTSGYSDEIFAQHHRREADVPLLRKPYKRTELAACLRQALEPAASDAN